MGMLSNFVSSLGRVFTRSMENPRRPLDPWSNALGESMDGGLSSAGVRVNRDKALTVPAFWRGVNLLTRTVAKLPLCVYRNVHPGREHDRDHHADWVLRKQPNEYQTPFSWKQLVVFNAVCDGNHYSYVFRDGGGRPLELLPLPPDRTYPVRENRTLWYVHELPSGEHRKLPAHDVLHVKGLSDDGLEGIPLLRIGKNTIGGALATAAYSEVFYRNSARPNIILQHPGKLTAEARKNLRESWERMHQGLDNAHRTAVLEEGLVANPLQINARDAQMIETKQYSLIEVANLLGLPPHKLGANISTSYGSLEQENRNFLDDAVGPWLTCIEEECETKLLTSFQRERDTHAVAFDRSTLLIADMSQRGAFYQQALSAGWLNFDEVRAKEGWNPTPGGLGKTYLRGGANYVGGDPDGPDGPAVAPGTKLIEVPDVRQELGYACGAAAARAVCQFFGVGPKTEWEYVEALECSEVNGTPPPALLALFTRLGLATSSASGMEVADLTRAFAGGRPVLCPIQADAPEGTRGGHWVVVVGTGLGMVFVQDPVSGLEMIEEEEWLARWHDRDAAGAKYERYGIAVGAEVAATTEASSGEEKPTDVMGLVTVIDKHGEGAMDTDAARAVLAAAYPSLGEESIARIIVDAPAEDAGDGGLAALLGGIEDEPTMEEEVTPADAPAEQADVADLALNGAQVTALLEVVAQYGQGVIGQDAAKAIVSAAFPTLDATLIDRIIGEKPDPSVFAEADQAGGRAVVNGSGTDSLGREWVNGKLVPKDKAKGGKKSPAKKKEPAAKQQKAGPASSADVHAAITAAMGKPASKADAQALGKAVLALKATEIKALREKLGLSKGSGTKQKMADELVAKVTGASKPKDEKPKKEKPAKQEKPKPATADEVHDALKQAMAGGEADAQALGKMVVGLKATEIKALRERLGLTKGVKGSNAKQALADDLVAKVTAGGKKEESKPTTKPESKPEQQPTKKEEPAEKKPAPVSKEEGTQAVKAFWDSVAMTGVEDSDAKKKAYDAVTGMDAADVKEAWGAAGMKVDGKTAEEVKTQAAEMLKPPEKPDRKTPPSDLAVGGKTRDADGVPSLRTPKKVKLVTHPEVDDPAAEKANLKEMFGPHDPAVIAAAACGVDGAAVQFSCGRDSRTGQLVAEVETAHDGVQASRQFNVVDGELVVSNQWFSIDEDSSYKGRGAEVFANQVQALAKLGVKKIVTCAAKNVGVNGYYTWARLGYSATLDDGDLGRVPAELRRGMGDSRDVLDLMSQPGGAEWWKKNGTSQAMTFDLSEGSANRKALGRYLQERSPGRADSSAAGKEWRADERRPEPDGELSELMRALTVAVLRGEDVGELVESITRMQAESGRTEDVDLGEAAGIAMPTDYAPPSRFAPVLDAARRSLLDAASRALKRIGHAARRAAENPPRFTNWLDRLHGEHGQVVRQILTPPLDALREAARLAGDDDVPPATTLAAELIQWAYDGLNEAAGRATARTLSQEVDGFLAPAEADPTRVACWKLVERKGGSSDGG